MKKEDKIYDLIERCEKNINNGEVNSFSSYDEGVRDALLWVLEEVDEPYIGRE